MKLISGEYKRKTYWLFNGAVFSALIALLIVFTFFDLELSKSVYDAESWFGKLFAAIGEVPSWLIAPLFFAVCFFNFKYVKQISIASLILLPFSNYFWLDKILNRLGMPVWAYWLVMVVLALGFSVLFLFLFHNMKKEALNKLFYIFVIAAAFALMGTAIVQLLKTLFGRTRFRDLLNTDYRDFTRWFVVRGITGNRSFPSGHTSAACGMFALLLLCHQFDFAPYKKILLVVFALLFILCTAISRIILGAHFATDVIFSVIIVYGMLLLSIYLVDKIYARVLRE